MNAAYLAHIIGSKPKGPRGDAELSSELDADPSNYLLLCDVHHRLIDREGEENHPPERLRMFKREHEARIERLTAIQADRRTHLLLFGTNIRDRQGLVSFKQARQAVAPARYPATEVGIRLDLNQTGIDESDPDFWPLTRKFVRRRLREYLRESRGPTGKPIDHFSIFALAPIPALIYLGKCIGDTIPADVYQRHRATGDWSWVDAASTSFRYVVERPEETDSTLKNSERAPGEGETDSEHIAVNLSLSGIIHENEIVKALGGPLPTYTITIEEPNRDFLRHEDQLARFRQLWQRLLAGIRGRHGERCCIHLFPAVPCSVAVEMGRSLLPKSDPKISVYDHDKERGGFTHVLTL